MYKNYTRKPGMPFGCIHKILLIMRLTAVFLIAAIMQVSASSYGQKITLSKKNASLISIFKEIRTQSGYDFLFDREVIEKVGAVNINVSNATLDEVLKSCLTSQPLTYSIEDKTVVIKEKAFLEKLSSLFVQDLIVNGVVNDENGMPLPGVSVMLKGTNIVRVTNARGTFALQAPNANSILVLSYLGYKTKEVAVAEKVSVNMELDPGKLDEVLVIGYGTTTRRFNTGSQSGISAKDLEKQPVTNVLQALQGRLAGVTLTQTNGLPGAGINVQIRGANGIGLLGVKPNRPLYIIDGVPYLAESINTATNVLSSRSNLVLPSAEGNTSPMNSINPADIENIEVLKDADATAIYGSRGGNGVILITTKKGKAGKTKFSVNASTGASNVTHFVETVGTEQYLALRRKAFANNTVAGQPTAANAPDLVSWDQNGYTDFQRLMLGNTAKTNDVNANLSGGDAQTNFYIGGNYHKEGNVYPGGQGYERGGGRFNLNHASFNQRFNLSLSAMYSTDKNNISTTDLATYAYSLPPNFPLYRADGGLNWDGFINNPMGYLLQTNDNRTSNLLTNLTLKYTLLKGLDIKSNVGYGKSDMNQVVIRPLASLSTNSNPTSGTAAFVYNYTNNYIVEPQVTYNTKIGKGTLNTLAGGSYQFKQSKMPYYTSASGYTSDDLLRTVAAATIVSTTSNSVDYKYASLFGRLNYNYDGKYIFNANFRRDGSSRFGPANKFGNFGSVGAAWIFSEEQFLKDRFSWFSFGKLRSSYGIVGSDEIDNYGYLDTYTNSTYVFAGSTGLNPTRLANPDFQWEETKKLDIGLELGFLKDRLSFTANYYRNRTGNQLLNATISAQAGLPGPQTNLPATVQNSGWEFTVNTTNIQKKDFKWTSSFNISQNKNKLLSFDNIEKSAYLTTYIVGNPISSYYLYEYKGIDPLTNLPSLTDFNNSGSISGGFAATGRGDRYYAGTSYPKFFGGLTNALTYKGVTLDFTFQFVKQKGISLLSSSFYPPGYFSNAALSVVNDYLALGSQDYLVSAGTRGPAGNASFIAYSDYTGSDASLVDASFIRMKNVNLSYVLPTKWLSKIDAQTIRIYVQAQNLFTITNYEGFDPESQGVATPPLRTITAGLQLTF
ncbi:SusC/RagA family TonB-linked outer membrane protein [Pedobacter sp. MC2016-14]|uniref:SusC/RagA family TonB-linked outer membrane protein n=1 Tax=Pedobacter sp. MC2016-14 TaxID=2897327 RepID=UPI001E4D7CF5|nr:SusC/RagA family TonB-linked outer membrane protein [Pedobacter sp. MC2016-14]MCD0488384.1 SusC/RagA family TonB-linked outer membrane protein [Pedobacter sp. MC2016-14]